MLKCMAILKPSSHPYKRGKILKYFRSISAMYWRLGGTRCICSAVVRDPQAQFNGDSNSLG
jgi:hypothetical protein